MTREAIKQEDPRGVQIGRRANIVIDGSRMFGRHVGNRRTLAIPHQLIRMKIADGANIDERRPFNFWSCVRDHVGGFDVPMKHAAPMQFLQGRKKMLRDNQRIRNG